MLISFLFVELWTKYSATAVSTLQGVLITCLSVFVADKSQILTN